MVLWAALLAMADGYLTGFTPVACSKFPCCQVFTCPLYLYPPPTAAL